MKIIDQWKDWFDKKPVRFDENKKIIVDTVARANNFLPGLISEVYLGWYNRYYYPYASGYDILEKRVRIVLNELEALKREHHSVFNAMSLLYKDSLLTLNRENYLRTTFFHELGHAFYDHRSLERASNPVEYRNLPEEREADDFAITCMSLVYSEAFRCGFNKSPRFSQRIVDRILNRKSRLEEPYYRAAK